MGQTGRGGFKRTGKRADEFPMGQEYLINGVFAGGGIKGIALAGAAAGALEQGYRFGHAVGTSSGALVASLIAAGFQPEELEIAVRKIPWRKLFRPIAYRQIPGIGKGLSILMRKAQFDGNRLESVWRGLLAEKGVKTFSDLPDGLLRVVTTDLTNQAGVVLPDHLPKYGWDPKDFSVAKAVRMSAAVPFFVPPVPLTNPQTGAVAEFVDGALTSNFPLLVGTWSNIWPIVGFRFIRNEHPEPLTFNGPASLARGVVTASISASDHLKVPKEQAGRLMIQVPVDRDPLDFDVSTSTVVELYETGRAEAHRVLATTFGPRDQMPAETPG